LFDPYHRWLGVPRGERPPNHYALLGLEPFEDDGDVISNMADRQMNHVRTYQTGPHAALSQQILNELAAARLCLLNPQRKRAYDAELKAKRAVVAAAPAPLPTALPQAVPLVSQSSKEVAAETFSSLVSTTSARRRMSQDLPAWLAPAAGGLVVGALLTALIAWVTRSLGGAKPLTKSVGSDMPAEDTATPDRAAMVTGNGDRFASLRPPSDLGVTADRLLLWNHHNGDIKDRGSEKCNVRLFLGGREVWNRADVEVPWAPTEDRHAIVALTKERFDRLRVEFTRWHDRGAGLREIEVYSGERNLALGCPAYANAEWSDHFGAGRVTDGFTEGLRDTGFLLPDGLPGFVEVDLSLPRPPDLKGVTADKLVIWNQHNGHVNNTGSRACDVILYSGWQVAWQKRDLELPWKENHDSKVVLDLPAVKFDRVRVAVSPRNGQWGGLAEVEVLRGGENLACGCPTRDTSAFDTRRGGQRVIDGRASRARAPRTSVIGCLRCKRPAGWRSTLLALMPGTAKRAVRWVSISRPKAIGSAGCRGWHAATSRSCGCWRVPTWKRAATPANSSRSATHGGNGRSNKLSRKSKIG
jgi:hypothetical protein